MLLGKMRFFKMATGESCGLKVFVRAQDNTAEYF